MNQLLDNIFERPAAQKLAILGATIVLLAALYYSFSYSPQADECPHTLADLPCGCQDVHYACGYVDREHDHVVCDGSPLPTPTPGQEQDQ